MKNNSILKKAITAIFDCDYDADDYDTEGPMHEYAQQILHEYPWDEVFACAVEYFKAHSSNLDQILNFVNLYIGNNFIDQPIKKPYEFAALIANNVDFDADWDKGADSIENFLTFMLDGNGAVSLYADPYYQLLKDPKFIAALDKLRKNSKR